MTHLFHGSPTYIPNLYLEPRISFDYKPLVYATDDIEYALVRCGNFSIGDFAIKEDYRGMGKSISLIELRENAFKDVFRTDGYIYYINKNHFEKNGNEYVSDMPVPIVGEHHVRSVYEALLGRNRYELVLFNKSLQEFPLLLGGG